MNDEQLEKLVTEIREEQHISQNEEDKTLEEHIKEAEYDINENIGFEIDYDKDLKARALLKNYILYRRFNRLAEFKQLYGGEYAYLQTKYYKPSNV